MPPRCDALLANADVLEVIAEHACATISDACSLRSASRGWRRAVDTTVRALVYVSQPALRTAVGASPVTLRLHEDGPHLDAVRIAFTCDRFPRIARLVVVAFALDGAKDELRESGVCGPRPVDCLDAPFSSSSHGMMHVGPWCDAMIALNCPSSLALATCVASVVLTEQSLTDGLCEHVERGGALRMVRRLGFHVDVRKHGDATVKAREARVLRVVGLQLTHLYLTALSDESCGALAMCSALEDISIACNIDDADCSAAFITAIVESGAPLRRVKAHFNGAFDGASGSRLAQLLHAVPSIVHVTSQDKSWITLPPAIRDRLVTFNGRSVLHGQAGGRFEASFGDCSPSDTWAQVTSLSVRGLLRQFPDLQPMFPSLRKLSVVEDVGVAFDDVTFPRTLTSITASREMAFAGGLLRRVAAIGQEHLRALAHVCIDSSDDGLPAVPGEDISPLLPFAGTLRSLEFTHHPRSGEVSNAAFEAVLAEMTELESLHVSSLANARCLLAGKHTRLRSVVLGQLHAPAADAPFSALVAQCPGLVCAKSLAPQGDLSPVARMPGWTLSTKFLVAVATRRSFKAEK